MKVVEQRSALLGAGGRRPDESVGTQRVSLLDLLAPHPPGIDFLGMNYYSVETVAFDPYDMLTATKTVPKPGAKVVGFLKLALASVFRQNTTSQPRVFAV